ncbi:MAG: hypothetical protein LBL86_02725 [Coriobacteriales bacterium]|jgi:hypothetical protein|nr:hypothetical protein [Coriobacteriales bacterium]
MIGRGRHNDVYLYEVTEQDLLLGDEIVGGYRAGNVLMFGDRRRIDLGSELAHAKDLDEAKEYLSRGGWKGGQLENDYQEKLAVLTERISTQDKDLRGLAEKIEQRDELLRDLAENLASQKQDNELLHTQLEHARAQLAVDELRHNEMVDDLQHVSEETLTIGNTLERVMDEKFKLEQELAERITDLVELNLQNDDLKKQLTDPLGAMSGAPSPARAPVPARPHPASPTGNGASEGDIRDWPEGTSGRPAVPGPQAHALSSDKEIHVLHEFPAAPRTPAGLRAGHALFSALRIMAIALLALLVLGMTSILATAQVNGTTLGAALDLLMKGIGLA